LVGFLAVAVLSLCFTSCKDTKTLQQNQQLKSQVADLQKENGQLGNDVETLTAARDELTKENSALQAEVTQLQQRPAAKTANRKHKRSRKSQQS
jgi:peptidoglycan hydrolase CwlO-like protein